MQCSAGKQNVMSEPLCITVLERAGQTGICRTDRKRQERQEWAGQIGMDSIMGDTRIIYLLAPTQNSILLFRKYPRVKRKHSSKPSDNTLDL
jgi:hypothetical protein